MARKKSKESSEKGPSNAEIIDAIARHLITKRVYPVAETALAENFVVYEPEPGESLIYREISGEKVVQRVHPQHVTNCIIRWCSENWSHYPELLIEPDLARQVLKNWLGRIDKIPGTVKSFEFADGESYVAHRVPFAPDLNANFDHVNIKDDDWKKKHPFIEFLSRCSSSEQVAAYLGSIFYEQSYNQQYLTIWGDGNDGKGSLLRALHKILEGAYHSESFEHMSRPFWTSAFLGKRLIVFPDNNNQAAMQSGLWKQLTGGDAVRIEFKNENSFTTRLNAKYLITSNFAPVLKMDRADQRRLIVSHVAPINGKPDPAYDELMSDWEQLQFLVEYSAWQYRKMCQNGDKHLPIEVKDDQADFVQNADEEIEQEIVDKFSFSPLLVTPICLISQILGGKVHHTKLSRILTDRFKCEKIWVKPAGSGRHGVKRYYYVGIGVGPWDGEDRNTRNYNDVKHTTQYKNASEKMGVVT